MKEDFSQQESITNLLDQVVKPISGQSRLHTLELRSPIAPAPSPFVYPPGLVIVTSWISDRPYKLAIMGGDGNW